MDNFIERRFSSFDTIKVDPQVEQKKKFAV